MKCIKTGCNVQYNDKIYHGDLHFNMNDSGVPYFVLDGVPAQSSYEAVLYSAKSVHATTNSMYFVTGYSTGNGAYDCYFIDEIFVTKEFYEFLVKWEPNVCQYVKHAEE